MCFLWEYTNCFFKQRRFYISLFLSSFDASFLYRALHHSLYEGMVNSDVPRSFLILNSKMNNRMWSLNTNE